MRLSAGIRGVLADTLAPVGFFTVASGLNERFVAGMSWDQAAVSRSIGAAPMVPTARPCGARRNRFMARARPSTRWETLLADGAVLPNALRGPASLAVLMLVLGRPYGVRLDFVRRRFGLEGPCRKPMSLGG